MKNVIEKIIKVINILINLFYAVCAVANGVKYAMSGCYIYSDELVRVFAFVIMVVLTNAVHVWLRKIIKEF